MRQIQIILNKIFKKNLLSNFSVNIFMGGGVEIRIRQGLHTLCGEKP